MANYVEYYCNLQDRYCATDADCLSEGTGYGCAIVYAAKEAKVEHA